MSNSGRVLASISSAQESIDWAEEELRELESDIASFFDGDVCSRVIETDEKSGETIYKVKLSKAIPSLWRRRVSGIAANARNAFDQATYAAVVHGGGAITTTTYFLWSQDPADLESLFKRRSISPIFWQSFRDVEPYATSNRYSGGDDNIRVLAQFTGKGKHIARLGVHACATGYAGPNVCASNDFRMEMPAWDPVKNEMVIFRYSGNPIFEDNCQLAFHVTFDEADPPLKCAALPLLKKFTSKARAFCYGIAAHLS